MLTTFQNILRKRRIKKLKGKYNPTIVNAELPQSIIDRIDAIVKTDVASHYTAFKIPKRKGGYRTINAPSVELKKLQRDILNWLTPKLPFCVDHCAKGFMPNLSIVDNAFHHAKNGRLSPHHFRESVLGGRVCKFLNLAEFINLSPAFRETFSYSALNHIKSAVKVDIKNAFDNVGERLIRDNWPTFINSDIALDKILQVCLLNGCLPQGAPTSPVLLNIAFNKIDKYITKLLNTKSKLAAKFTYTRYADDIIITSKTPNAKEAIGYIKGVLRVNGLEIKKSKTRIMNNNTGIFITGINIVNASTHLGISKRTRHNIRAALYNISKSKDYSKLPSIIGKIRFIASIDKLHANRLIAYGMDLGVIDKNTKINKLRAEHFYHTDQSLIQNRNHFYNVTKSELIKAKIERDISLPW